MEYIGHFIQNNPTLKQIDLSACQIDANGANHLAKILSGSQLEKLDLNENSVSDRGCTSLLSSIPPTLTDLSLRNNDITELSLQTILHFLAKNQSLKTLYVMENPVCEAQYIDRIKNAFW